MTAKHPPPNGAAVDARGNPAFDPTPNVDALVLAAVTRLNDLMDSFIERQNDLRNKLDKRISELSGQRERYETRIEDLRSRHYEQMEDLRSKHYELVENIKADFGKQIANILASQTEKSANLLSTQVADTTERLAVVEKNQYITGGQSAVRDPAIAEALNAIQSTLSVLSKGGDIGVGSKQGQAQIGMIVNAIIIGLIGVGSIITPIVLHFLPK